MKLFSPNHLWSFILMILFYIFSVLSTQNFTSNSFLRIWTLNFSLLKLQFCLQIMFKIKSIFSNAKYSNTCYVSRFYNKNKNVSVPGYRCRFQRHSFLERVFLWCESKIRSLCLYFIYTWTLGYSWKYCLNIWTMFYKFTKNLQATGNLIFRKIM